MSDLCDDPDLPQTVRDDSRICSERKPVKIDLVTILVAVCAVCLVALVIKAY